jgi:hypothetical protein
VEHTALDSIPTAARVLKHPNGGRASGLHTRVRTFAHRVIDVRGFAPKVRPKKAGPKPRVIGHRRLLPPVSLRGSLAPVSPPQLSDGAYQLVRFWLHYRHGRISAARCAVARLSNTSVRILCRTGGRWTPTHQSRREQLKSFEHHCSSDRFSAAPAFRRRTDRAMPPLPI